MSKDVIRLRWENGLGDSVNFCHVMQLWRARGYSFEVACDPDFMPLFELAGARIIDHAEQAHPWMHPFPGPLLDHVASGSKILANLRSWPLPDIGRPEDLWEELVQVSLRWPSSRPHYEFPRPLVVCHWKGVNGPQEKDLPSWIIEKFQKRLLAEVWMQRGTLAVLHGESHLRFNQSGGMSIQGEPKDLTVLFDWLSFADLFIGIDSGPLHTCRLTDTPALGVWTEHRPWHYALPRERTVNLIPEAADEQRMNAFQCVAAWREDYPEAILEQVRRLLT